MTYDQSFLFGDAETTVGDDVATRELRLLAWNIQSPSVERVRRQLGYLYDSGCNVLVLTEVKSGDASQHLVKDLESNGYDVIRPPHGPQDTYVNVIAAKGYQARAVQLTFVTPRLSAVRLSTHLGAVDVLALYGVTNAMTADSSRARAAFQREVLHAVGNRLLSEPDIPLLITGDFNVLQPGHIPPCDLFEEHDYAFYQGLLALGLVDAYRAARPEGTDVSWMGPRGGQRLDHTLASPCLLSAGRLVECGYDHTVRATKLSDHSALLATLAGELTS
nr:endonuclease/exonuclease/phosphatase family protein [Streptomyces sp. NBC_00899]